MSKHYKLDRVSELADGDKDFVVAIAATFLEEVPVDAERLRLGVPANDYNEVYQAAHKMKPTIELFGLGVYDELIEIQDWGKFKQEDKDVSRQLESVLKAIENTIQEIRSDFGF